MKRVHNERGAGRKPLPAGQARIKTCITLPQNLVDALDKSENKSAFVEAAIAAYLDDSKLSITVAANDLAWWQQVASANKMTIDELVNVVMNEKLKNK